MPPLSVRFLSLSGPKTHRYAENFPAARRGFRTAGDRLPPREKATCPDASARGGSHTRRVGQRAQPDEFHRLPGQQFQCGHPAPCQRIPHLQAIQQRHARQAGTIAFHHRSRPVVHHAALGTRVARIRAGTGSRGEEQLRTRGTAGPHQRHQPDAARPIYRPVCCGTGRRPLRRTDLQQRPSGGGLHQDLRAHRRHD